MGKINAIGMVISHVGDLFTSGDGDFIAYLSGELSETFGVKVLMGGDAIYLLIAITNGPNEFFGERGYFFMVQIRFRVWI